MAAAGRSGLEELQLTAEEVERLKGAFRDERFRALLAEYAAELADPEQRRRYEEEVAALERERGVEVRFVHPAPGYVLRTSQGGAQRCYLNVCSNPLLGRPQARAEPRGQRWALPYSLAPGREELGRAGRRRLVYDVVFHPETLRLAARSARFRRMVSDTALEAVQSRFGVQLDRANATPLRGTAYKGVPQASVIRTPLPGGAPPRAEEPDSPLPPFPSPYSYPASSARPPAPAAPPGPQGGEGARPPSPTAPRWSLRHRSYVDLQDYRCCRDSAPSPVPRELVVTIELPLLSSAGQAALEIRGRELRLDSQRPAYRLRLRLPYAVDENRGQATFNKAKRQLLVTLPVLPPPGPSLAAPAEPSGASPGEPEAGLATGQEQGEEAGPAAGEEELGLPPTEQACAPGGSGRAPSSLTPPGRAVCPGSMDLTSCTATSSEADPPLAPSNGTDLPTCPSNSLCPAVPTECLSRGGYPDLPAAPSTLAAPGCPPFQCTQDEESLTLLLQVPNIQPESLKGEVGTNHYKLGFCSKDAASYSFLLQFPLENKLTPPETGINVSPNNAVIGLAKSPESAGLWGKMYFGVNSNALQERLFVSEENVDEFLDSVLCPSFLKQTTLESQPLIESQEGKQCELGEKEQTVNNSGRDQVEKENRSYFKTNIEANHIAADTAGEHGMETDMTSGSFTTDKTIGVVDCSPGHCLQLEPIDTSLAISGKSQINEPQLELAFTTGKSATSSDCEKQELLHLEEQAKIRKDEEVMSSEPAEENQHHLNCTPIVKEINMQDGSVQIVRDHTTHCAFIFQNSLLYELD
ncbi:protein kintoun isoform X2 [Mauremys reevesii]|uniref:protein kintoun isoform X2 n=1 Tax=Mauremys reevesii TaxID=260615 RepID=UPI00193F0DCF|nr:protein kintoun isoform X2 [Mauremys reevesii]